MNRWVMVGGALALLAGAALAQQAADTVAPEAATVSALKSPVPKTPVPKTALTEAVAAALSAKAAGRPVQAKHWMVVAANPRAVQAGARVLRQGGSAADAMIAVQAVLGLVEPQSSGLGGGAFLVWYDAKSGQITTLDGRETAPLAATPRLFQDATGQPLEFFDAVVGGRSVGTPGTPALLAAAHERWGILPWAGLFEDAIELADQGFAVSPRLASLVQADAGRLGRDPATAAYFLPKGTPVGTGQILHNPAYADTLRILAREGIGPFYIGRIARDIVAAVKGAMGNPGVLDTADLAIYSVRERPAICAPYRIYSVCGMGPPSSGALTLGQILGMVANHDLPGPDDPQSWRLIGDASRLAFADRGLYMADVDFVPVPVKGLIAPDYLAERARLLTAPQALPEVTPGKPAFDHARLWAPDRAIELPSTSHISIVDAAGNALSMTTTIENGFGARLMVRGYLLNNELTDFSFVTQEDGRPVANRVEPGKRPRSSMAPTIVLRDGKPVLVIGAPGGSRIIGYVAQALIAHLDWGMDVQQAVSMGHLVNRFGTYDVEAGTSAEALATPLRGLGYQADVIDMNSGTHAIAIDAAGLHGGADPRREGIALGD